jgi:hypothetical protein
MNLTMKISIITSALLIGTAAASFAQKTGEIDSQTFEVEKKKRIELPQANRLYTKQQPFSSPDDEGKMTFEFRSPKLNLASPKTIPNVLSVQDKKPEREEKSNLDNFLKIGGGNYGKIFGEAFVGGQATDDLYGDVHFKHLSNQTGPVDAKNSATSQNTVGVNGKYQSSSFKISTALDFDRQVYYFYGNRTTKSQEIDRDNIKQTLNQYSAKLGFENIDNTTFIDYSLKTTINRLTDKFSAAELDWATSLNASIPILPNFYALVNVEAYVSQLADAQTTNRNLYRVKPSFKYVNPKFTITAAFKAVNETDSRLNINRTTGFPIVELDVSPFAGTHIFAGYDGDINRNTLRSFLSENRWLAPNVVVANTEKSKDIYGGLKGEIGSGFQFEAKVSYATYKNFYVFNNSLTDTTKFSVLYDADYINTLTVSGQLGYVFSEDARTTIRGEFYDYSLKRLEVAYGRPKAMITWNNSIVFKKKLFATLDVYYINGLQARNFVSNKIIKQKDIIDLNLKIDYLLTRNFSAYISINNILGRQYERYAYYPQQGLNFLGGLSFSF